MKRIFLDVNGKEVDIIVPSDDVDRIIDKIENKKGTIISNLWSIRFEKDKVSLIKVEEYQFEE